MTKLLASVLALALAVTAPAFGHEEFRVIGEITQSKAALIEVKTRDGKVAAVHLDEQTSITKDKIKTDARELKPGQFVVIDAYGDDYSNLLAIEIRLVPPIAPGK